MCSSEMGFWGLNAWSQIMAELDLDRLAHLYRKH